MANELTREYIGGSNKGEKSRLTVNSLLTLRINTNLV